MINDLYVFRAKAVDGRGIFFEIREVLVLPENEDYKKEVKNLIEKYVEEDLLLVNPRVLKIGSVDDGEESET